MALWKKALKKSDECADESGASGAAGDGSASGTISADSTDDWQARYDAEHEAFERYRSEVMTADEKRRKSEAYRALLGECGIPERHRDRIAKLCDTDGLSFGEDGKLIGADELKAAVKSDWAELLPKPNVPVAKPAMSRSQTLTKESIMAIRNRDARRAAMLDNPELFGL